MAISYVDSVEENKKVDKSEKLTVELVIFVEIKVSADAKEVSKSENNKLADVSKLFSTRISEELSTCILSVVISIISLRSPVEVVIIADTFFNIIFSVFVHVLISKNFGIL